MHLINWPYLEDLLVRACEAEVRQFAATHPVDRVFAMCVEYDGLGGDLSLSYGRREDVERAVADRRAAGETLYYREAELRPEYWFHRGVPRQDAEGAWRAAEPILRRYRENMDAEPDAEATEFHWLRFEYLAECVVRRLMERGTYRYLSCEEEFLAFAANENETLEELEDRVEKLHPRYQRATVEFLRQPRVGEPLPLGCAGTACTRRAGQGLLRCTYCQQWYCQPCAAAHDHPNLFTRNSFFRA